MTHRFENLSPKLIRAGILVCQTVFLSIILTYVISLTGLIETRLDIAFLGGILIFNTTLMYFRALNETNASRPVTKYALAGLSAFVGGSGIAICLGIIENEYALALQPLPILLLIPLFLAILQSVDEAARSEQ